MSGNINGTETFDHKAVSAGIVNSGFRPELYTVANGSYTSNVVYGSGAALVNTYLPLQLSRGTTTIPLSGPSFVTSTEGCDHRQSERDVDFVCSVVLNSNSVDPDFGQEELRIRPRPRRIEDPPRYIKALPIALRALPLPLFEDVEIVNKAGVQIAPDSGTTTGTYIIQARLLQDGTLALVLKDLITQTSRGLTADDIDAGFIPVDNIIRIIVSGHYKSQVSLK